MCLYGEPVGEPASLGQFFLKPLHSCSLSTTMLSNFDFLDLRPGDSGSFYFRHTEEKLFGSSSSG